MVGVVNFAWISFSRKERTFALNFSPYRRPRSRGLPAISTSVWSSTLSDRSGASSLSRSNPARAAPPAAACFKKSRRLAKRLMFAPPFRVTLPHSKARSTRPLARLAPLPHLFVRLGRRLRVLVVDGPLAILGRHLAQRPGHLADVRPLAAAAAADEVDAQVAGPLREVAHLVAG